MHQKWISNYARSLILSNIDYKRYYWVWKLGRFVDLIQVPYSKPCDYPKTPQNRSIRIGFKYEIIRYHTSLKTFKTSQHQSIPIHTSTVCLDVLESVHYDRYMLTILYLGIWERRIIFNLSFTADPHKNKNKCRQDKPLLQTNSLVMHPQILITCRYSAGQPVWIPWKI